MPQLFLGLQKQMIVQLSANRENIVHPGTKGDASELSWIEMLQNYLPQRYQVRKAFVLDSTGELSEQIDIVIFDRHYSPFLFNQDGALYVPAESVYAVIEVKQDLNKEQIEYAGSKQIGDESFNEIFHPIARRLVAKCDACLRIGGASKGADEMVAIARQNGKLIFYRIEDIPAVEGR